MVFQPWLTRGNHPLHRATLMWFSLMRKLKSDLPTQRNDWYQNWPKWYFFFFFLISERSWTKDLFLIILSTLASNPSYPTLPHCKMVLTNTKCINLVSKPICSQSLTNKKCMHYSSVHIFKRNTKPKSTLLTQKGKKRSHAQRMTFLPIKAII